MNTVLLHRYAHRGDPQAAALSRAHRLEKIEHLQCLIESGEYETERRLDAALQALLAGGELDETLE